MHLSNPFSRPPCFIIFALFILLFSGVPSPSRAQGRVTDEGTFRGNRAEVAVTVRDASGGILEASATVRLYKSGALCGQTVTSKGHASFVVDSLGDFSITVEVPGYKKGQKDFSLNMPILDEEDVMLQRDSDSGIGTEAPGKPLLAPKAKESLDKGLQELSENRLDQAEKELATAEKLAPNTPDVLYAQGLLYMKRQKWPQAQAALETATQIDPNHARALGALGMTLVDQKKYETAIPPLEHALQLDPGGWESKWALAKAYYFQGQYTDAVKMSQQALEGSHGTAPDIELLVAQSQTAVGHFDEAAKVLREYLKNHGDQPGAATAKRWLDRMVADGKAR
jgi:cytochrome c-type biogenesis protein CcmH/NrfG